MASIYRFEKIDRFRQLVDEQALTFVLPELWPDKREGYLFRAVQSPDGVRKVQEALKKVIPASRVSGIGLEIGLLQLFNRSRYAQCWSKCRENDALWKGYEVRVEAEGSDISQLADIQAHDVRYVDAINLEEELRSLFTYPDEKTVAWRPENVILVKRTEFSHEQEVRLLTKVVIANIADRDPLWVESAKLGILRREYQQGKITKEQFKRYVNETVVPAIKKVSIAHIPNFIKSVLLNPFAPDEVDKEMASFCAQHTLNYLGRSRMYEFEI